MSSIDIPILTVRGQRVILDSDLASLYGTSTKVLNQAVRRNMERFPDDCMLVLTQQELVHLRSQIVTSKRTGPGGRRYLPQAFTAHGAMMAANVLNSKTAIEMSIRHERDYDAVGAEGGLKSTVRSTM